MLAPLLLQLPAAAGGQSAGTLRAVDLRGLETRSAALLLSGQEAGDLEASFLLLPLSAASAHQPVLLVADLVGGSLLEAAGDGELIVELYAYALGPGGDLRGMLSRAFRIDRERRALVEQGGVKFLGRLDLPPGKGSLRLLVLHRASGRFALRTLPLEIPAPAAPVEVGATAAAPSPALLVPPFAVDSARSWLIVDGGAGTPLPPPFGDPTRLPATRLVAAVDGSPVRVAPGSGSPVARLLDLEGRQLSPLAAAADDGGLLELTLAGHEPRAYLLELFPAGSPERAIRLPLELVAERPADAGAWFERPPPPDEPPVARAERPMTDDPAKLPSRALAAYQRAFAAWRLAGLDEAAAELGRFEQQAAGASGVRQVALGQLRAGDQLAAADPESLVPLMCLHERLFRDYQARDSFREATHARRLALRYAQLYAARGADPSRTAALVLVSLGGMRQEIGTRLAALATFEAALELDPEQPEALLALAALKESVGEYHSAVDLLRRLRRVRPLPPAASIRLAVNLARIGSPRQALTLLGELTGKPPAWVSLLAYQEQVRLLAASRDGERALAVLDAALAEHPGDQGLLLQRAVLLDRLGQPLESRRTLAALEASTGDRGESSRLRYSTLPAHEIAAARTRLAEAAADRLAEVLDAARRLGFEEPAP